MTRISDGPDYDFGPYDDEYRGFEMRDDDSKRGPLILLLALGVLLIFAGVVWNTYRQGVRPAEGGLPIIAANDDAPYKRAPDERGGLQVAGQENAFYGQMDGLGDPAVGETDTARNPAEIRRESPTLAGAETRLPPVEGTTADVPDRSDVKVISPALEGLDVRTANTSSLPEVKTASLSPIATAPNQELPKAFEALPTMPKSPVSRFSGNGGFQIQLMALRTEAAAQSEWRKVQAKDPELYHGANLDIQYANLGAKGVFYRLRLGAFETRADAAAFCNDVRTSGRDCIVVAKAVG